MYICYNYCISLSNKQLDYCKYVVAKEVNLKESHILLLIGCTNISKTSVYCDVKKSLDMYNVLYKNLTFYRICIFNHYSFFKKSIHFLIYIL